MFFSGTRIGRFLLLLGTGITVIVQSRKATGHGAGVLMGTGNGVL